MDINSQQLINTFVGGMNTDTSDSLLESNQYRYAENLRVVTNTDSNSGELRMIEGTKVFIPQGDWSEIIKIDKVRDIVVFITRSNSSTWSIWKFKDGNTTPTKIFGPCSTKIWETGCYPNLSTVLNYESENNIKYYIADGIHEIMVLNVANNPDPAPQNFNFLIEYQSAVLPKLNVSVSTLHSGQLIAAKVQYAYRLYTKGGLVTTLSPLSQVLHLYKDGKSGYANSEKTARAVEILIPSISSEKLDYIQIYRINYIENGLSPTISLIVDDKIQNQSSSIMDVGNDIKTIAISEFVSFISLKLVPKQIEVKNNYLFSANVEYSQSQMDLKYEYVKNNLDDYFQMDWNIDVAYEISDSLQSPNYYDQHLSFRPGEVYRFGIILYDNSGNKTSVFHFANDFVMPDYSDAQFARAWYTIKDNSQDDDPVYRINSLCATVRMTQSIPGCSYYEVVRCIRTIEDKYCITQGLLGRPMEMFNYNITGVEDSSTKQLSPSGFFTMNQFKVIDDSSNYNPTHYGKMSNDFLQFTSPEIVYQPDDVQLLLDRYKNTIKFSTVAEYVPYINKETVSATTCINTLTNTTTSEDKIPIVVCASGYRAYVANEHNALNNYESYFSYMKLDEILSKSKQFTRNNVTGHIAFNTIYPRNRIKNNPQNLDVYEAVDFPEYNIKDIQFIDSPKYNDIAKDGTLRYSDDVVIASGYKYYKWSNPFIHTYTESERISNTWRTGDPTVSGQPFESSKGMNSLLPVGSGGACILAKLDSSQIPSKYNTSLGEYALPVLKNAFVQIKSGMGPFVITVADIRKSALPYGGNTEYAKNTSVYRSFGDVFLANTNQNYITSGDCYVRMFKYNALHNWYDTTFVAANKMGTVYGVPIFTDIDLLAQYGCLYNKNLSKGYYILDYASSFDGYVLEKDAYMYNTAYNANIDVVSNTSITEDSIRQDQYDTRIHYSEQKTNNEDIDSWTQFRAMNFSDVDSRFGEITGLKLFKDKLVFWQENATGVLAVNERVILQDANDTQVTLGTGQVLDRYDYISTVYGMKKDQSTACVSNDALYWWDGNNRELLQYAEKYSVVPLSQVKNIRNYINDSAENNHPHVYYNNKYKEVVFQCVNNEAVAYSEILQRFTSVYTVVENNQKGFIPTDSACVNDTIYITDGKTIETDNTVSQSGSKLFGYSAHPYIKYIVNANNTLTKTFDTQIIGGELYGGSTRHELAEGSSYGKHRANGKDVDSEMLFQNQPRLIDDTHNSLSQAKHILHDDDVLKYLEMRYNTPLKQTAHTTGTSLSNREYDYRLNIPRETGNEVYGGRLKGKTMQCELWSTKNSIDFSLQYIITKYRMSWS